MSEELQQAFRLEDMGPDFDPVKEIRSKRRAVTWVGAELLDPAQEIMRQFRASKQTMPDVRRFQAAVVRYAKHTLSMVGVSCLVTEDRVIIGRLADLRKIYATEEELREQGKLPEQDEPSTASAGAPARERAGEAWGRSGDPGERSELPEGGREEVPGHPADRGEDYEQTELQRDQGDGRED